MEQKAGWRGEFRWGPRRFSARYLSQWRLLAWKHAQELDPRSVGLVARTEAVGLDQRGPAFVPYSLSKISLEP